MVISKIVGTGLLRSGRRPLSVPQEAADEVRWMPSGWLGKADDRARLCFEDHSIDDDDSGYNWFGSPRMAITGLTLDH